MHRAHLGQVVLVRLTEACYLLEKTALPRGRKAFAWFLWHPEFV